MVHGFDTASDPWSVTIPRLLLHYFSNIRGLKFREDCPQNLISSVFFSISLFTIATDIYIIR